MLLLYTVAKQVSCMISQAENWHGDIAKCQKVTLQCDICWVVLTEYHKAVFTLRHGTL